LGKSQKTKKAKMDEMIAASKRVEIEVGFKKGQVARGVFQAMMINGGAKTISITKDSRTALFIQSTFGRDYLYLYCSRARNNADRYPITL